MLDPTDLNLRHLDAVLAVDGLGGITAAAHAVNMSQSALTEAIRSLERQLGQELFARTTNEVITSGPGRLLISRIERAITQIVQGCQRLRSSAKLPPAPFPQRHLSMKQVRAFLAVERANNYSAAARALGLRQPSVHRAVSQLERMLGVQLFVRTGLSIRPTQSAERFARRLRLALLELRSGLEEIACPNQLGIRRLAIGALSLPLAGFVPKVLGRFAQAHTGIEINLLQGTHVDLLLRLENGDIDMLIDTHRSSISLTALHQEVLFTDGFRVAAAAGHPLAGTRPTSRQLAAYPWLVGPSGAPIRDAWTELFPASELPGVHIECTSTSAIRSFLLQGNWLALLSSDQFELEQGIGAMTSIEIPPPKTSRTICLTTRRDWKPTPLQQEVVDCFRSAAAALGRVDKRLQP